MPLSAFHPVVREWLADVWPTHAPQLLGWPSIARGRSTLICPHRLRKKLAHSLGTEPPCRRAPAANPAGGAHSVRLHSRHSTTTFTETRTARRDRGGGRSAAWTSRRSVAVRTGILPVRACRMVRHPRLLITTPESLYLMLTSPRRSTCSACPYLIVDEIHALCATSGGSLSLSMERLQEIGSGSCPHRALRTQRPLERIRFLVASGGRHAHPARSNRGRRAPQRDDLAVACATPDFSSYGHGVWPLSWGALRASSATGRRLSCEQPAARRAGCREPEPDDVAARGPHSDRLHAVPRPRPVGRPFRDYYRMPRGTAFFVQAYHGACRAGRSRWSMTEAGRLKPSWRHPH